MDEPRRAERTHHNLWNVLKHHLIWIILWTIIAGALGFVVAKYVVTPQYNSQIQMLVSQKSNGKTTQPNAVQQADVQMINTYKDLITSRKILVATGARAQQMDNNIPVSHLSVNALRQAVNVSSKPNSQIFSVNVKTTNPKESSVIANSLGQVFKTRAKKLMHVKNVTVVSWAVLSTQPGFPNTRIFVAGGALLGFIISFVVVIIRAFF